MNKRAFCLIAIILLAATIVHSSVGVPHSFKENECTKCHVGNPTGKKSPLPLTAPQKELCVSCHKNLDATSYHPVGMRPTHIRVPADMPLSKEGHVTCATCHDIHAPDKTPLGKPSHFLRRQVSGRQFCAICHVEEDTKAAKGHVEIMQQAHFRSRSRFLAVEKNMRIDPTSLECLACHDGSIGKQAFVGSGVWTHNSDFLGFDSGLHPIGVDYERARVKLGDLRPASEIDKRVKLVQGKVSCVSCHDPYSMLKGRLAIPNYGSKLCFECHMK